MSSVQSGLMATWIGQPIGEDIVSYVQSEQKGGS